MPKIIFNAFSFLQMKLKKKKIPFSEVPMTLEPGCRARDLFAILHLTPEEVEAVFINGRVSSPDTILKEDDRVAFIPPGTPGPYRVLLGFFREKES